MPKEEKNNTIIDAENFELDYNYSIMHYAMDENGHFTHQLKNNWGGKELANTQSWEIVKERIRQAKAKVISREISPIAYYMEKCITDTKTLSLYVGIAKWRVKRHLKVKVFEKLSEATLKRYADFFGISVDQLKNVESLKH